MSRGPLRAVTGSAAETEALGAQLAERLLPGDLVVISGEIGAGKTTLVRGACRALGVAGPVTSPTFVLGRRYEGSHAEVAHLDLYRLDSLEGEDIALLDDYLGPGTITFIEWAAAVEPELDGPLTRVTMRHAGGDRREIEIIAPSRRPG
ncbi:MAG: tRNA (adenosine(37)-N6)-threonylcarbamoyltransferase complex ATPase subunit type 1 TsaE [Solirubrobacterales bacterium]